MMLKTCCGFSSLRSGVNLIAVINMIFFSVNLFGLFLYHIKDYLLDVEQELHMRSNATFDGYFNESNTKPTTLVNWHDYESTAVFIYSMWTFLIVATNIGLKQSTYKPALHKIYVWLVINYVTLLCLMIHLINYITLFKNNKAYVIINYVYDAFIGGFIPNILFAVIFTVEIYVVHSYYIEDQKAMLNDVLQLKWKHVSKNQVISQSTAYPSASPFKDTM